MSELSQLSCGHSCIVARPEGMATNGGCHCLDDIKDHDQRRRLHKAFILYRAELAALREVVPELSRTLGHVWCDVCGCLYMEPGGCVLADHVEAYQALQALARLDAVRKGDAP